MGKSFPTSDNKWKISRILGLCCELIGGLILWMLGIILVRNAAGYPPVDFPAGMLLLAGCGLLLLGIGLTRLAKNE